MKTAENMEQHLTPEELNHFRELLLEKRSEAKEILDQIDDNITNLDDADDADYSSITHHLGDVGSDVEEEELNYQLKERTRKFIEEINDALERIEKGTYGICKATGKPIAKGRLEAVPHTRYSIEAKNKGLVEDL
ncbi:MAG: TraR/DksA C4-type zinc finger protein [Balneolaceae bacterium]|nr:TraR/DksA C4-type zinc finger protein [Balneolaceae bacterium]